jgi:hypothetical protein
MFLPLRQTIAIFLAVIYGAAGGLSELAHRDCCGSPARPALVSHDCGDREIHRPVDGLHPCLACTYFAQRVSTEAEGFTGFAVSFVNLGTIPADTPHAQHMDIHSSGKRGPPIG